MNSLKLNFQKKIMKFNKIYAFIFALSFFLIANPSAKANILDPSIRDSHGNVVPEFNLDLASQCYKAYSYNRETMSCFSSSYADELGYNYILIESGIENYPYYVFVLSHYNKFRTSTSSDTYYYGGRYYLNENATIHLGYYYNERYNRYDFDFGVKSPYNLTISANYQFLGYYSETLNGLQSATIPETSYNSHNYYNNIYNDGLFMKFRYSISESKWVSNSGGTNFMLYNPSTGVKNVNLDENNHANILYSSFDIYDYDNNTIVKTADSKPPAIEEEHEAIDITYKHSIIIKKNNKNSKNSINDIVLFSNTTDEKFRFHYKKYNENHLRDETYLADNQEIKLNNFYYKIPNLNMENEQIIEISKGIDSDNIISSSGSSGGGHGSGGGRHDFIQPYKKIVYLDTTEYDYCVLEDVNSECEINGITYNQIYSEFSSSDNIIEDLNQYLSSKTKGIQASNYILTSLWNELDKKYKYTILTMLITSLITIIYLRIVK